VLLGQGSAVALLRPAIVLLLTLNGLFLFLLFTELRPALNRIYKPRQLWQRVMLGIGGAMILPLGLILMGDSPPLLLAAVLILLLGSLAIRFEIIKIPHAIIERNPQPNTHR
jgi:hypothetical protein